MSKYGNERKNEQLGMPFGTASGRLRKLILFNLLKEFNKNICYQCKEKINSVEELSIEHIIPWLDSKNPVELFFDMNNIAFSHLACNVGAVRIEYKKASGLRATQINPHFMPIECPEGQSFCSKCREFKSVDEFNKHKNRYRKVDAYCKECRKEKRKNGSLV